MIEFQINDEKEYLIWWDNEYEELYFLIEPITPIKIFSEKDGLCLEDKDRREIKKIQKRRRKEFLKLPQLRNATYRFALYSNKDGTGKPLREVEKYFGKQEAINIYFEAYRDDFIKWKAVCKYKISKDLFWLSLKDEDANEMRGRFYLPSMQKCENGFETSCLLKKGAESKLGLCLDDRIKDCIHVD